MKNITVILSSVDLLMLEGERGWLSVVVIVMKARIVYQQKPLGFIFRCAEAWSTGKMHFAMLVKLFELYKQTN